ncbi:NAD-dependent DNA ligase LigA [Spirochaeta cellobiosiphila]|uniref:NAD-dependent DNA ligase LigA n=1 Tax=Spirochaeta cellobiosiphila TaxID=504483 RepID=UPI000405BA3E|nr:NAD-dependent DNA ligase LigA [Spirochaeta cellobiosiphila]
MTSIELEIDELKIKLKKYQFEYYVTGKPIVSDREYDRLFDRLLELESKYPELKTPDSPTMRVGSDLTHELPEVEHTIPVLSLDKAYSEEEVIKWVEKTERNTGKSLSFVLEEKIDGISIVLYYDRGLLQRAVTRGNGSIGNDVTANVKTIGTVPLSIEYEKPLAVRGEIYLPKSLFAKINKSMEADYANPRNLAAGTIRRIKSSEVAKVPLNIFIYEGFFAEEEALSHVNNLNKLRALGFRLNSRTTIFDHETIGGQFNDLSNIIERMTTERPDLDYEIDGLVLKVDDVQTRESLGYTGHHPRWAIAYKFESPAGITQLIGIDIQVGRTGRITPVGRVEPINIGGATIANVTLHNQSYIDLLELSIGDMVSVSRRGDVIPAVEKVVEKSENSPLWHMPDHCPVCHTPLIQKGAHHFCPNHDCPDQIKGRIRFFVGTDQMDIRNLGPETLDVLLEKGMIKDIQDLYTCDFNSLEGSEGFGSKKIKLIQDGIEASKERHFSTVLASLGIPDLGKRVAQLLVQNGFSDIQNLIQVAREDNWETFASIPGIGEKMAKNFVNAFGEPQLLKQVQALGDAGLQMQSRDAELETRDGIFMEQSWCITGSFEHYQPRSLAETEIKQRGGRIVSSVSSKTTHLLAGEKAGSKLNKARELGLTIVDEQTFLTMIGQE